MIPNHDLVIRNGMPVVPGRPVEPADIAIRDGKIVAITAPGLAGEATRTIDAGQRPILPGVIDSHVHYGYGDAKDDYRVETASAARAGVTTTIEYYRQPGTYLDLQDQIDVIAATSHVNVGLHLAIMGSQHLSEIQSCVADFGIPSFKVWMSRRSYAPGAHIVIQGFEEGELLTAMEAIAAVEGGVLALHAENLELFEVFRERVPKELERTLRAWHLARPASAEAIDILKAGYLAKKTSCPIHIVHLGSKEAMDAVRIVRGWGVSITVETTPYFLTHTIDDRAGVMAKVNPPVREREDVEAMWDAVCNGEVTLFGTDHAAKPADQKRLDGTIWDVAPGFPGTFTLLPVILSEGVNAGRISLGRAVLLLSENPAQLFGLPNKGRIAVGADADLVIVDLDTVKTVTPALQASVAPFSIYDGWELKGWPTTTIRAGEVIVQDDTLLNQPGQGKYQYRGSAYAGPSTPSKHRS